MWLLLNLSFSTYVHETLFDHPLFLSQSLPVAKRIRRASDEAEERWPLPFSSMRNPMEKDQLMMLGHIFQGILKGA